MNIYAHMYVQYLKLLVPNSIRDMVFGTKLHTLGDLDPLGQDPSTSKMRTECCTSCLCRAIRRGATLWVYVHVMRSGSSAME